MFKMILSAIVALGFSFAAYAADPAAETPKTDMPAAADTPAPPTGDHKKMDHKAGHDKMDKMDKKAKKKKHEDAH